jgi:short-subunit dehydrogenase
MSFKGKRIIVTGAGRGLGAAFAVTFADHGAEVIMTGRSMENMNSLAESIRLRTGTRPETIQMDLADISQVTLLAKKMRDEGTPVDILINNGAQWLSGPMDSHDALAITTTITGNIAGTLLFTRGLLPLLEKSGAGDILNMVSISGMPNVPMQGASVAYIASKHVRVSAIYPPNIRDISPLNEAAWNEVPDKTSWPTTRDVLEAAMFSLTRPRHVSIASIMLESDTGNFQGH